MATTIDPKSWVLAPVFIPKDRSPITNIERAENEELSAVEGINESLPQKSYAQVVGHSTESKQILSLSEMAEKLCPYTRTLESDLCPYGDECMYVHGDLCDMCGWYCLHPTDLEQRKIHHSECMRQHESDMELSFAIARSKDKTCGICFEIIMEKSGREQRFGILPGCNHIFCLECIRKWRQAKQFDNKIIRACPECRVTSDFVCPSIFWVDTKEEKEKLLVNYRNALVEKPCKYFKQGEGKCPFGNKCFYKHALPNGVRVDVGVPQRQVRRHNHLGEFDVLQQLFLWDFMDDRDQQWLDELATFLSDEGEED